MNSLELKNFMKVRDVTFSFVFKWGCEMCDLELHDLFLMYRRNH